MARGPKIVVVPERTKEQIAAAYARRMASPFGRLGIALQQRRSRKERRRREREVEQHWATLEGRSSPRRSRAVGGLVLGVSALGGALAAEKLHGIVYRPMGQAVPASALALVAGGVGAYATRKRYRRASHVLAAASVGVLIGIVHKEIVRRSGGKA